MITVSPPASIAAVGILPLESAWTADFVSGRRLMGHAAYMFDRQASPGLLALSLFHFTLSPTLLWLMRRLGYDRRGLAIQCGITPDGAFVDRSPHKARG
jgi:hypothetical protein